MIRLGVDFGGTKIEVAALDGDGRIVARRRAPTPRLYAASVQTVCDLVKAVEAEVGISGASIGVGLPGSISPATGLVRNANSVWLNGQPFDVDLAAALHRPVRVANDANCFALSEAIDGAAAAAKVVFGVIIGTGCGAGVVVDRVLRPGANGVAGEWGHTPLPWPSDDERPGHECWCGRRGCLETWISGAAFCRAYAAVSGQDLRGDEIMERARAGDQDAMTTFERYVDRLGRGLTVICDILDPDVIVFGGGMSNVVELYPALGPAIGRRLFSDSFTTPLAPAKYGASSGVRGAAWLWPPA